MRVTFICPAVNMSGGIRVIGIYAEHLTAMGHDVQIFSVQGRAPHPIRQFKSLLEGKGLIPWARYKPSHLDGMSVSHHVLPHSGPIIDADLPNADVVVATWWETAAWVAALSDSKGAKAYFMQDYGAPGQEIEKIAPTWQLPLWIITLTEGLAHLIRKHCGNIELSIVPNSVDLDLFNVPERSKQPSPTVGFVYRATPSKGIDIALHAFRTAQESLSDLKLVAYGPEAPSPDLPIPEGAIFHLRPVDDELPGIYSSCDAWIFPSRQEGFGLPILEAMACRTPVIATPVGAAPELVTADRGFLVPEEDSSAMADAIVKIAHMDNTQWRSMSDAAYSKTIGYSWRDAASLFEAGLRKAVERGGCKR